MDILFECLFIGLVCSLCCHLTYNILEKKKKDKYKKNIIICFLFGCVLHYLIKDNNLTEMYCRKICYGNRCITVCKIT